MVTRRLQLLGPARVSYDQGEVPRFRSQRTVALLGYLTAQRRPVARDHLAALFWPDQAASRGRGNLRRELHNLARVLPDCWQLDRQAVAFVPSPDTSVDLYRLLELEQEKRWREAAELLGGEFLEGLYLEENLEFETWLLGERERWRGRSERVLGRMVENHTRRGQYAEALRYARRLLQLAPWNEAAQRQVMRLLAWTDQRGAALRQFESCKEVLWRELGVEPAGETVALCQQIQAGELDRPPPLPAFLTQDAPPRPVDQPLFVARKRELRRMDGFLQSALAGRGGVVLIAGGPGRGKTALMDAFALQAQDAHPDLLVANGHCNAHSGVGDPYLPFRHALEMLTADAEDRWAAGAITTDHARRLWAALPHTAGALLDLGADLIDTVLPGRPLVAHATAAMPLDTDWVNRLARVVEQRAGQPGASDVKQRDLYEQYIRVLQAVARQAPLLLTLDDLQWADEASIGLLFHLGRRVVESRILLLCAYRPEELALGRRPEPVSAASRSASGVDEGRGERHPLEPVFNELRRVHGDIVVDLADADRAAGRGFVDALLDGEPNRLDDGFRQALFDLTGAHPLFTVELLHALQERGDLTQDHEGRWVAGPALAWDALPARVEAVIQERVGRLEPSLRETLAVASVEGEVFTPQVISRVQDIQERRLLRQLSHDLQKRHRLVREQGEARAGQRRLSRFRFAHHLFQLYLYNDLSAGERRLLHGEVARALEGLYAEDREPVVVQLAYHFRQAEEPDKALHYQTQAGHQARRRYANEEAIAYYRAAVEQLAQPPLPGRGLTEEGQGRITQLHEDLGDVLALTGQHDRARSSFEKALSHLPANETIWQARLERKVGTTWDTQRLLKQALVAYRLAETTLESQLQEDSAPYWHEWLEVQLSLINLHYLRDCVDEMGETLEKAQAIVERHGTQNQQVRFLHNRNLAGNLRERFVPSEDTLALSRTALAMRKESGNPSSIAHGQFNLGFNLLFRGAMEEAKEQLQRALEFGATAGDAWLETVSLTYLTVVHRTRGQVAEAKRYAERTMEAAQTHQLDWYIAMAHANLAWVAWRAGNATGAQEEAGAALEIWERLGAISPFQWTARWPSIGVALERDNVSAAIDRARALLDPRQQRLPDRMTEQLEAAIQAWEAGDKTAAHTDLKRAATLARDLGYI